MARPELPYLGAGIVAIVGGIKREGQFPANGATAVGMTAILVIVVSATAGTKIAPLAHAFGLLVLLAAVIGTTKDFQKKAVKPK